MKKVLIIISLCCFWVKAQDTIATDIAIDSLGNQVFLIVDNQQRPQEYFSPIFTPVCVDGSCYPINIELHWDLAGDYLKYSLPKDEILTKIEHLPFTDFDYGLLHRMIAKLPSALANFSIYELTLPGKDKVDGITGATRPELSGSFVPDALFTTYTLWHLARKPKGALMSFTRRHYFEEKWESFIMHHSALACRKEFINHLLMGKDENEQAKFLFTYIERYSTSFPNEFIHEMPNNEFTKKQFINLYQQNNSNELKVEVLSRWKKTGIDSEELIAITEGIGNCSSCFSDELLLIQQFKNWTEQQYELLYLRIQSQPNMMRKEKMKKVLEERFDSYPKKFKKVLKKHNS